MLLSHKHRSCTTFCRKELSFLKASDMKYVCCIMITFLLMGCQKEIKEINAHCDLLQQGLADDNVTLVSEWFGDQLDLPYSEENLNHLAQSISESCDVTAALSCFDCVKTDPPQSEMQLSYVSNGNSITKTLDLTITADKKIKLVSLE